MEASLSSALAVIPCDRLRRGIRPASPAPAGDFDPAVKVYQGQFGLEITGFFTFSPVTVVTLRRLSL